MPAKLLLLRWGFLCRGFLSRGGFLGRGGLLHCCFRHLATPRYSQSAVFDGSRLFDVAVVPWAGGPLAARLVSVTGRLALCPASAGLDHDINFSQCRTKGVFTSIFVRNHAHDYAIAPKKAGNKRSSSGVSRQHATVGAFRRTPTHARSVKLDSQLPHATPPATTMPAGRTME